MRTFACSTPECEVLFYLGDEEMPVCPLCRRVDTAKPIKHLVHMQAIRSLHNAVTREE